jgi:diacylglycerol kinase
MKRFHTDSFKYAWAGIVYMVQTQPNLRVHFLAVLLIIASGLWTNLSATEWAIIFLTFALVIISEMLNTAVESVVDLVTTEFKQSAKIAKDVASGMVLTSSLFAIIIGAIILAPKIINQTLSLWLSY